MKALATTYLNGGGRGRGAGYGRLIVANNQLAQAKICEGWRRVSKDIQNAIFCLLLAINSPYLIVGTHTANTT